MRVQQFLTSYWEQFTPSNLFRIEIDKSLCHCLKDERPTTTQTIINNIQGKRGVDMWTLSWVWEVDSRLLNWSQSWSSLSLSPSQLVPTWRCHSSATKTLMWILGWFNRTSIALESLEVEQARQKIELCWRPSSPQQEFSVRSILAISNPTRQNLDLGNPAL